MEEKKRKIIEKLEDVLKEIEGLDFMGSDFYNDLLDIGLKIGDYDASYDQSRNYIKHLVDEIFQTRKNLTKEEIDEVNRILNADDSVYDYTGSLEEILEGHPILFESAEGINGDMVYILKDGSKEIHKIK